MVEEAVLKVLGAPALVFAGDPAMYDRFRWIRKYLKPGNVRTFDAGCGSGAYALYAASKGNTVIGASFNREFNERASRRAQIVGATNTEFLEMDLRQLSNHSGELGLFDQVMCLEVIEHIIDDERLVADLSGLLAPGGRLLLTTNYLHRKLLPNETITEVEDGGHVTWGYTHESLTEMFERHQLEVVETDWVTGFISQKINALARRLSPYIGHRFAWAATFPLRVFQLADPVVTAKLRYPSLCVGLVAVKRG